MFILISFCNMDEPGRPALGLLDTSNLSFCIPKLPKELGPGVGITGLASSVNYIYAALQETPLLPSGLLILHPCNLNLLAFYRFQSILDVHSIWSFQDSLYVVSSGTDEVFELRMNGHKVLSESVLWRPEFNSPPVDNHHLNGVCVQDGDVLVSGFGKKSGPRWGTATSGFIFNVTRNQLVTSPIYHPHSVFALGNRLFYCESSKMAVRELGTHLTHTLPGYARGLCAVGNSLFVGTSIGRRKSKSTGLLNNPRSSGGVPTGRCTISCLDLETFSMRDTVDLSSYASEIYDLMPLQCTESWELSEPIPYCPFDLNREVTSWIPSGSQFILVDDDQFGTDTIVAGRHRIPFLERDGRFWGPPEDDDTAVRECERLRRAGANFLLLTWPCFWWINYYSGFHYYLRSKFRCLCQNDQILLFDLRE